MTPLEKKRQYRAYRKAARRLYQNAGMADTKNITVTENDSVHRLNTGGFVQMTVWIPLEQLTVADYDAVLQDERDRVDH